MDLQQRAELLAAERDKRTAKHVQMRALITWLVQHRFAGKQVNFCDAIKLAPAELSRYKNGKTSKGAEMLLSELDTRHWSLRSALERAQDRSALRVRMSHVLTTSNLQSSQMGL